MANPYRAFRQFERKIFRGVPEQPEPISQRDINAQVAERVTGRSQLSFGSSVDLFEGARRLATIVYGPNPGDEQVVYLSLEAVVDRSEPERRIKA